MMLWNPYIIKEMLTCTPHVNVDVQSWWSKPSVFVHIDIFNMALVYTFCIHFKCGPHMHAFCTHFQRVSPCYTFYNTAFMFTIWQVTGDVHDNSMVTTIINSTTQQQLQFISCTCVGAMVIIITCMNRCLHVHIHV